MKWKQWTAAGAALGLVCAQPAVAAAPKKADDAAAMAALGDMFKADPLTPEQQARLPAARALMLQIMPSGSMAEMYKSMFKRILDPFAKMLDSDSSADVAKDLGQESGALDLTEAQAKQAMAILDPAAKQRKQVMMQTIQTGIAKAMTTMEPEMREGMAEAYAVNFDSKELADIAAFFATPSGTAYARRSFTLASDPHVLAAAMKSLPKVMGAFGPMQAEMEKATADLPQPRGYDALSPAERQDLAKLTGLSQDKIKAGMADAAKRRAADKAAGKAGD